MFPSYPTAAHIEAALKSNTIWPENAVLQQYARFQAEIAAQGAKDACENITGWGPLLAERDDAGELVVETRLFDGGGHNGDLNLQGGLLRLDRVSIGGTVQTRDYAPYLHRYNRRPGSPIVAFRGVFWGCGGGYGGSIGYGLGGNRIAITGVWGRFLELPSDVFKVCQSKAVADMMDAVYNQQSIGSISYDGFSESFDITGVRTQQNIAESGAKNFNGVCQTYMRGVH